MLAIHLWSSLSLFQLLLYACALESTSFFVTLRYESEMTLPHLPDMVFTQNSLKIDHSDGFGLRFEPLEPLRFVNDHDDLIHVAMAGEWVAAR